MGTLVPQVHFFVPGTVLGPGIAEMNKAGTAAFK